MATAAPTHQTAQAANLDVDWLLHGKRDFKPQPQSKDSSPPQSQDARSTMPSRNQQEPSTPRQRAESNTAPDDTPPYTPQSEPQKPQPVHTSVKNSLQSPSSPSGNQVQASRAVSEDPSKKSGRGSKKDGKRSSWLSSIGHKISGSSSHATRSGSVDSISPKPQSPGLEFQNPFDRHSAGSVPKSPSQEKKEVMVPHAPATTRRPSVLVAAGTETKLDQPGFLTSALRRLSSGSAVTLGKGAGSSNAATARRIMNIDQNRERTRIADLDQNKLRRVAFCVDVEIAGIASQADEEPLAPLDPIEGLAASNANKEQVANRTSESAKYKGQGEGAALKGPDAAKAVKDELGKPVQEIEEEKKQDQKDAVTAAEGPPPAKGGLGPSVAVEKPMTRKKEKKKRSEAERKERREKKRRHAEMNGLVPLELTREDDSSSSSCETLAGASTPNNGDKPTTNPLRIYKRCCQLRETTALNLVKDQISKPAASLAEAPGQVGLMDLSGSKMALQDIVTLADWLAVVPVRKLILDDCDLSDEAVRVILSALLGCKTSEQARANRKLPRRGSGKPGQEQLGVIEKLSLKNNKSITSLGWKHIALFLQLSRSLRAIDLTGVPYPKSAGDLSRTTTTESSATIHSVQSSYTASSASKPPTEIGSLVARAIKERFGNKLEEILLSGCSINASNVSELMDAAIKCKIRRLGLAGNNLDNESLGHVVRYALSDVCEGLDLGSNDLHDSMHLLHQIVHENNPMVALSLADCNLTPDDLTRMLPKLCEMKNFKFLDLSRNYGLFEDANNAVPIIRKYLPRMKALKRIHLADVDLTPEHIIALSDIFPDCPVLAHINILENAPLIKTMNSSEIESQEEAAAFLASLMTSVRMSHSLVAMELEVPGAESSEVVKALSQQIVAYSLRNMERSTLSEFGVDSKSMPDKDAPEVLLHLVGHMDGYDQNHDLDEPAPDDDYLIASTGIVRALSVCLGNTDASRSASRTITPTASGTATPKQGPVRSLSRPRKQPKDVSRELCEAARKIRMRLQPALVKEDRAGDQDAYRRLWFLDQTLQRIIKRFEDEYPDVKASSPPGLDINSPPDSPDLSRMSTMQDGHFNSVRDGYLAELDPGLKPSGSSTQLASKALSDEEGRMHRFGTSMNREMLRPSGGDEHNSGLMIHPDMDTEADPAHLLALRSKIQGVDGQVLREMVEREGADKVVEDLKISAAELKIMAREDPAGFDALRNCSLMNEVRRMD